MCKTEKPLSAFRSRGGAQRHLVKSRCNSCLYKEHFRWTEEHPDRVREYRNKDKWTIVKRCSRHGITPEVLITIFENQGEKCPICTSPLVLDNSAIDHNHATGEVRGILCKTCNRALGMFKDSPEILTAAANYLTQRGSYQHHNEASTAFFGGLDAPEMAHVQREALPQDGGTLSAREGLGFPQSFRACGHECGQA